MRLIKLKGKKSDSRGTVYEAVRVDSNGDAIGDEVAPNFFDFTELAAAPAAPAANHVRLYAIDNGSGKTQLMARFSSGSPVQVSIQP